MAGAPEVYVVTPVYNGEAFLEECIESVLRQTHPNWRYVIVDNCSTDRTGEIAERLSKRDERINVHRNNRTLDVISNWNLGMRLMPPESRYCKVLHADDVLLEDCLERMVEVAEANPSVGIVGAYVLQSNRVVCDGLPFPHRVFTGAEVCRSRLRGETHVFGTPTTSLIRADVVRARDPFYDPSYLHADAAACFEVLRDRDWGYVHQVLTCTRLHRQSLTSVRARPLQTMAADNLRMLLEYGPMYFSREEFSTLLRKRRRAYYDGLAQYLLRNADPSFLAYQRSQLQNTVEPFSVLSLAVATVRRAARHPRALVSFVRKWITPQSWENFWRRPRGKRTAADGG